MDFLLWLPEDDQETIGFFETNSSKAIRDGLTLSSIKDTIQDVYSWYKSQPFQLKMGVSRK